jgi:radical SAM superfamily enzyme
VDAVKIHNLYIETDAPLAALYREGRCPVLGQAEYVDWVIRFLERLHPETIIQRLTGDPDPKSLLAPLWALEKQRTLNMINQGLENERTFQGSRYDK